MGETCDGHPLGLGAVTLNKAPCVWRNVLAQGLAQWVCRSANGVPGRGTGPNAGLWGRQVSPRSGRQPTNQRQACCVTSWRTKRAGLCEQSQSLAVSITGTVRTTHRPTLDKGGVGTKNWSARWNWISANTLHASGKDEGFKSRLNSPCCVYVGGGPWISTQRDHHGFEQ